jgi:hypothetical protein
MYRCLVSKPSTGQASEAENLLLRGGGRACSMRRRGCCARGAERSGPPVVARVASFRTISPAQRMPPPPGIWVLLRREQAKK